MRNYSVYELQLRSSQAGSWSAPADDGANDEEWPSTRPLRHGDGFAAESRHCHGRVRAGRQFHYHVHGVHYLGIMVQASQTPTLLGQAVNTTMMSFGPVLCGTPTQGRVRRRRSRTTPGRSPWLRGSRTRRCPSRTSRQPCDRADAGR